MKTLLITHKADIDGLSPLIFLKILRKDVDGILLNANELNQKVVELINTEQYKNYDEIYITDLTLDKNSCELIMKTGEWQKFHSFDHHASNLISNEYPFGTAISTNEMGVKECATSLFYKYLKERYKDIFDKEIFATYTELVRLNDTWDWTIDNNQTAKKLNDLHSILGRDNYVNNYVNFLQENNKFFYTEKEEFLLSVENERIERYLEECEKTMFHATLCGKRCGIVFAEQNRSLLGNYLATKYKHLVDFVVIINMQQGISYRCVKDDIDVSEIATVYGGGGHVKASGSPMSNTLKREVIKSIFKDYAMFN